MILANSFLMKVILLQQVSDGCIDGRNDTVFVICGMTKFRKEFEKFVVDGIKRPNHTNNR